MSVDSLRSNKLILVVDDESDIRTILKAVLSQCGYSVTEACDGREALDILAEKKFDLMILDLLMPGLTGKEVLERLRFKRRLREMRVILLTAIADGNKIIKGFPRGVLFWVPKPFKNTTIQKLVRYCLENLTEEEREEILLDVLE